MSIVLIVWLCSMLIEARKDDKKKQHLEKKEYAIQLLVGSEFSGCEFHVY